MAKYQQYDEYKESGIEWLGEIPNSWQTGSLRWMIDIASGESLPSNCEKEYSKENQFPVVGGNGVMGFSNRVNTADAAIAVGRVGALCGNIHSIDYDSWITDNALKISKWNKFSKDFLVYLLKTANLNDLASKTAQPLITGEQVKSLKVVLLPIAEQKKIANFLDHETAQIDTLIEKQQTLIQLLKEKRQAVISHAVTKGLNPDAPIKDSGIEWLGEVPKHWTIPQIGYHSKVTKLTGFEYTNLWHPNIEGKIIALRGFNIQERYLDLSKTERITEELSNKLARSKLYEGDIVLPCTGTLGNAALIQENDLYHINQNIAKVTINSELFNTGFTVFWMTSLPFRQMIDFNNTSGMQPVLLIGDIRKLPIPLLPLDEQQEIVDFLLLKTEHFDRLINNAEQAIQLMQERRTALISAAVTGKIDVRGWQASN